MLLVKQLVFALVKTVEFSLDNADASTPDVIGAGYEYDFTLLCTLETGYFSTVRRQNTGLQQLCN